MICSFITSVWFENIGTKVDDWWTRWRSYHCNSYIVICSRVDARALLGQTEVIRFVFLDIGFVESKGRISWDRHCFLYRQNVSTLLKCLDILFVFIILYYRRPIQYWKTVQVYPPNLAIWFTLSIMITSNKSMEN